MGVLCHQLSYELEGNKEELSFEPRFKEGSIYGKAQDRAVWCLGTVQESQPMSSVVETELVYIEGEGLRVPTQLPTPGSPWPRCPSGTAAMRMSTVSLTLCWMPGVTCPRPCELAPSTPTSPLPLHCQRLWGSWGPGLFPGHPPHRQRGSNIALGACVLAQALPPTPA